MATPSMEAFGLDGSDKTTKQYSNAVSVRPGAGEARGGIQSVNMADDAPLSDQKLLALASTAESQSSTFMQSSVRAQWARSYKAFHNRHAEGSKYLSDHFKGRSKFFRPKTRAAIKRKMAQLAKALFGSGDVIAVTAQNEADDWQVASAALKQEILNYRLSRSSRRNGIRWFIIASGAMQTSALTGLTISKQTWRYKEDKDAPPSPSGKPSVVEDRPDIELVPPENCLFDPNCDWTNPAQDSTYLIIRYPHSVGRALEVIRDNLGSGNIKFRDVTEDQLRQAVRPGGPIDTTSPRSARNQGRDPTQQVSGPFGQVWLNEVFMKVGGRDYVYWTINNTIMISDPTPVRKAYPAFAGDRPVVIGYAEIEAFRPYPMAPAESWQGLQMEINDQANLRLDHMKQVVSPPVIAKRGSRVDLQQVQRKAPNSVIMANDPEADLKFFQQPDVPQSAYMENNVVTADFDSLAGVFDAGSVANNRQMSETVGGMKLLAQSTNPLADFDLNVFVETWAEPVMVQLMKLEEYYESDETVLAIAGQKARLFERFGISEITDQFLLMETSLTLALGVGASNVPEEKLRNFANAWQLAAQVIGQGAQMGLVKPPPMRAKAILDFIFSGANIKDGAERFFGIIDDSGQYPPPQGNPEADAKTAQANAQREKTQIDAQVKMATLDQKRQEAYARLESDHMKALAELGRAMLEHRHGEGSQARDHVHDRMMRELDHAHGMAQAAMQPNQTGV